MGLPQLLYPAISCFCVDWTQYLPPEIRSTDLLRACGMHSLHSAAFAESEDVWSWWCNGIYFKLKGVLSCRLSTGNPWAEPVGRLRGHCHRKHPTRDGGGTGFQTTLFWQGRCWAWSLIITSTAQLSNEICLLYTKFLSLWQQLDQSSCSIVIEKLITMRLRITSRQIA